MSKTQEPINYEVWKIGKAIIEERIKKAVKEEIEKMQIELKVRISFELDFAYCWEFVIDLE